MKTALSGSNPYLKICLDEYSHFQMFIFPLAFSLMRYLSKTASEVERYSARIKGGKVTTVLRRLGVLLENLVSSTGLIM